MAVGDRNVIALTTIDALSTACIAASETRRRSLRRATLHSPYASDYKHAVTHSEMTGREKWSPLRKPFSTVHVRSKVKIIGVICEEGVTIPAPSAIAYMSRISRAGDYQPPVLCI